MVAPSVVVPLIAYVRVLLVSTSLPESVPERPAVSPSAVELATSFTVPAVTTASTGVSLAPVTVMVAVLAVLAVPSDTLYDTVSTTDSSDAR